MLLSLTKHVEAWSNFENNLKSICSAIIENNFVSFFFNFRRHSSNSSELRWYITAWLLGRSFKQVCLTFHCLMRNKPVTGRRRQRKGGSAEVPPPPSVFFQSETHNYPRFSVCVCREERKKLRWRGKNSEKNWRRKLEAWKICWDDLWTSPMHTDDDLGAKRNISRGINSYIRLCRRIGEL
jgi:hypothetical protein